MSNKQQRKVDKTLGVINELLQEWENRLEDPMIAEKEIRRYVEKIVSYQSVLSKNDIHLKNENEMKISEIRTKFVELSESIFEIFNNKYPIEITYDELINKYRDKILSIGVSGALKKEKTIEKIYHNLYEDSLPEHPKDEHPLARYIKRCFVIHTGPTNSGKTYKSLEKLKKSKSGMYLAPLRLLALEVYEKLNLEGTPCNLKTGEEEIQVPFSHHTSSTIEKADLDNYYDLVVIDEAQMIGDESRGNAWARAIMGIYANEIHICCSLNAVPILTKLIEDCGDTVEIIEHKRSTPLLMEREKYRFPSDIKKGDALIVFSRKMVLQVASVLSENGIKPSVIYGNLPPDTRRRQVQLFVDGETEVVVSTDAIGMGLNLPIRRIIFLETEKFDGNDTRSLYDQEIKQIAGRAGRKGLYPKGYVNSIDDKDIINEQLYKKDEILEKIYIGPLENTILSLGIGSLKEKLEYWKSFKSKVSYIEKADIEEQLELLDLVKYELQEKLSEEQLYRAIHIPFNYKNNELLALWNEYLEQTLRNVDSYKKPAINLSANLSDLETMYREVDLYYSFGKVFKIDIDQEWIKECREVISERIHDKLISEMIKYRKKCKKCEKSLAWNSIFDTCDKCYFSNNKKTGR